MNFTTLISITELARHLDDPNWVTLDCRFYLTDPPRGRSEYLQAHIPGAVYAHLDEDLSGPVVHGQTGRHPLPNPEIAAQKFSDWGIGPDTQVVAYDSAGGGLAAGRAWWMLGWLGHPAAAVLDGGWQAWQRQGLPVQGGIEANAPRLFIPHEHPEKVVNTSQVNSMRLDPKFLVFDARTAERYRGDNETIDPVAGHIPGALSAPYLENLTQDGAFQTVAELRKYYQSLLQDMPVENAVFYCGSGVTSIVNILALAHAGMGQARLYAGSWSEWISDPQRPVAK
jgi:thiosulfate/3-mercaptopyruvate sulfurtransferase